jgi:hypothetical protein
VAVTTLDQEDIQRNQRFSVKGLYFASITHSHNTHTLDQEDIRRNQRFSIKRLYFTFITYFFTPTHVFSPTNSTHYLTTTPQSRLTNTFHFPYPTTTHSTVCQTTRTLPELLGSWKHQNTSTNSHQKTSTLLPPARINATHSSDIRIKSTEKRTEETCKTTRSRSSIEMTSPSSLSITFRPRTLRLYTSFECAFDNIAALYQESICQKHCLQRYIRKS